MLSFTLTETLACGGALDGTVYTFWINTEHKVERIVTWGMCLKIKYMRAKHKFIPETAVHWKD